jgi:dihydroorotase
MSYELALNNADQVYLFKDGRYQPAQVHLGISEGKIATISSKPLSAAKEIDLQGLIILPGVIDSQVHFREPGMTHKEDIESGSKAAALGGVTSFFEMPNTNPPTTTEELLEDKMSRAKNRAWVNYAFYIGGSKENIDQLAHLESLPGCAGIKIFMGSSFGNLLVDDLNTLEKIFRSGRRRIILHSEDEARMQERKHIAVDSKDVRNHPVWRDVEACLKATQNLLNISRITGRPVHVLHVTSADEMELLAQNKDIATVEVLPQHLTFFAPDCYDKLGTKAQQNPPIREKKHQDVLWKAVQSGVVDVIGSDHAPHTLEEKAKPYPTSPGGMPMVQTLVPIMLNHVNNGKLSLSKFAELVCENPRRVFGCKSKGRIEAGLDADFTIIDMNKKKVIENKNMATRVGWTPFDGMQVQGWPIYTIVGGHIVMENDQLTSPCGEKVLFT